MQSCLVSALWAQENENKVQNQKKEKSEGREKLLERTNSFNKKENIRFELRLILSSLTEVNIIKNCPFKNNGLREAKENNWASWWNDS